MSRRGIEARACPCGETFEVVVRSGKGKARRYCSDRCRANHGRYRRGERRREGGPVEFVCRMCREVSTKPRRRGNPRLYCTESCRGRARALKGEYGLGPEEFWGMYDGQGGGCYLCERPLGGRAISASVDHCHDSGRVRGLAHRECNKGIGCFGDDPERLLLAAAKLEAAMAA